MATTANFNAMLKRYQPYKLHWNLLEKENWFIGWVNRRTDWNGGVMEVPLQVGNGASFQWGALTAENDIGQEQDLMGTLDSSDLGELWGSQVFHHRDMRRHMEKSYLLKLPEQMKMFTEFMSQMINITYFGDGSITVATADGTSGGVLTVREPWRLSIGMKITIDDDDSSSVNGYITAIDINAKTIKVQDARSGGSDVNLSGFTTAQNAKVYLPGYGSEPATLRSILLSNANGGNANYFGYQKSLYPVLQSINIDGSGFEEATLLDDLYQAYYTMLNNGKGGKKKVMVAPLTYLSFIASALENNRRFTSETKKSDYGFRHIELTGPDGMMEMVFLRDCFVGNVFILDKSAIDLCGQEFFNRHKDPDGNEYHTVRATTGYSYIVDTCFEAALALKPSYHGIIHSIPATLP